MNQYTTGAIIKRLRKSKKMGQQQLADKLYIITATIMVCSERNFKIS